MAWGKKAKYYVQKSLSFWMTLSPDYLLQLCLWTTLVDF